MAEYRVAECKTAERNGEIDRSKEPNPFWSGVPITFPLPVLTPLLDLPVCRYASRLRQVRPSPDCHLHKHRRSWPK